MSGTEIISALSRMKAFASPSVSLSSGAANLTRSQTAGAFQGEYFPHIDGIRALAILPVVLFHICAALCPGGFAGVDVFFVISGYLITGSIIRDLKTDHFSIPTFYFRRIRRILPAYFAMILIVFTAGSALYYSQPLILLGDAVAAGTLFMANLHFWSMAGDYFSPEIHTQPLLHLWSLSVEEQFYLFIPLLCAICWKFRRNLVALFMALIAILSMSGAINAVMIDKQANAFYLLQYRAWELLIGSLLSMLPIALSEPGRTVENHIVTKTETFFSFLGLLFVLVSYACISSSTPFPGLAALPAVIGAALLIRFGQLGWVGKLLSCRLLVIVGKISYSLYLWHWPVIVFWKYAVYNQLIIFDYIGMFVLSMLLGFFSWKLVEIPFRTSQLKNPRHAYIFAASGISILVTLGSLCVYYEGWPKLLNAKANQVAVLRDASREPFLVARTFSIARHIGIPLEQYAMREKRIFQNRFKWGYDLSTGIGVHGQPVVFLMGDSHAGAVRYGLDLVFRGSNISGYAVTCSSTDMFDLKHPSTIDALRKLDGLSSVSKVILVEKWTRALSGKGQTNGHLYAQLEDFATYIRARKMELYIATDVPEFSHLKDNVEAKTLIVGPPRSTAIARDCCLQSEAEYDSRQGEINRQLANICIKTGAVLIPLHLSIKTGKQFIPYIAARDNNKIVLYKDDCHLCPAGSVHVAQFIMTYLFSRASLPNQ